MRKQGKPTYTVAKAYRVVTLLSCLGKVVETVVASFVRDEEDLSLRAVGFSPSSRHCRRSLSACCNGLGCLEAKADGARVDVKGAYDRVNDTVRCTTIYKELLHGCLTCGRHLAVD